MTSCGEAMIELLERTGTTTVFGIPGVHTLELYRGLTESGIRHVTPRHEQGAGFMADAWARVTGRPGVCILISGPGLTNAITPIAQAYQDSIPMLVDLRRRARARGAAWARSTTCPTSRACSSKVTAFSHSVDRPGGAARGPRPRAATSSHRGRPRPVHIEIALDVLQRDAGDVGVVRDPPRRPAAGRRPAGARRRGAAARGGGAPAHPARRRGAPTPATPRWRSRGASARPSA